MRADLAGTLSAFEVMWNNYYCAVTADGGHDAPLSREHAFYVLAEAEGSDALADDDRFQKVLEHALHSNAIVDAIVPKSESERDALWIVREQFEPALPAYLYDVSMPIKSMSAYVSKLESELKAWRADAECYVFGHIADGNLHIFVKPFDDGAHHADCDRIVYGCLEGLGGSISAEHGIGIEKKHWLGETRSGAEIKVMRSLKKLLDPNNLLNPGKVVD
jgi:FAD/FMN-containing dehydrogenase